MLKYLILFSLSLNAIAAPIDEALIIVFTNNAALSQYHKMSSAIASENKWKSSIKLNAGYADQTTQEYASGFDARAGVFLEIPLGQNPIDKSQAGVILALSKAEQALKAEFLGAVTDLMTKQMQLRTDIELHSIYMDRLEYFKKGVARGITQESALWNHVLASKTQEHKAAITSAEYKSKLEAVSRTFGGERWNKLQFHIIAHIKSHDPVTPKSQPTSTD